MLGLHWLRLPSLVNFTYCEGITPFFYITRRYVICQCVTGQSRPEIMGQLPADRFNAGFAFDRVGVNYAGPIWIKSGRVRKLIITKAYVALFVSLSVKAAAFIATLCRFIVQRGKPSII